jgi:hypothetical protein
MDLSGMPEPFDHAWMVERQVDAVFAPLHGLQKAVTRETGIPAAFIALPTSTLAITQGKYLTSLA